MFEWARVIPYAKSLRTLGLEHCGASRNAHALFRSGDEVMITIDGLVVHAPSGRAVPRADGGAPLDNVRVKLHSLSGAIGQRIDIGVDAGIHIEIDIDIRILVSVLP